MKKNSHIVSVTDPNSKPIQVIVMLAWPIFLEQVLVSLVQSVDTAMVGSLGAAATASISISQTPINLINSVIMALGVGFTTMIARAVGAKQLEYSRLLIRQSILVVVGLGIPLSVLTFALSRKIPMWMGAAPEIWDDAQTYIRIIACSMLFRGLLMVLTAIYRGFGDSKTPMMVNIAINLVNVLGNYLLIYQTREISVFGNSFTMWGAGMGVAGAAIATAASPSAAVWPRPSRRSISSSQSCRPKEMRLKPASRSSSSSFGVTVPGFASTVISTSAATGRRRRTASSTAISPIPSSVGVPPPK